MTKAGSMERVILFRASGSREIGTGHIRRCGAIACEARKNGWLAILVLDSEELEWCTHNLLLDSFSDTISPYSAIKRYSAVDLVVLDSYILDEHDSIFTIPATGIVAIQDQDTPSYPVTFTLNQTLPTRTFKFMGKNKDLSAPVVDSKFFAIRRRRLLLRKKRQVKIVISGGGSDLTNYCQNIADILMKTSSDLLVTCFTHIPLTGVDSRFTQLVPGPRYLDALRDADLVFSGSGTSVWELLTCRIPFGFARVASNQSSNYSILAKKKFGVAVGVFDNGNWQLDENAVLKLVNSHWLRTLVTIRMHTRFRPISVSSIFRTMVRHGSGDDKF